MNIHVEKAERLDASYYNRWNEVRRKNMCFDNPYFHPKFTQTVSMVRDDVYVGVIEENSIPVGFFPFHRAKNGTARPLALALSDYQGVISDPALKISVPELMAGCGIKRWYFDHLLSEQKDFEEFHEKVSASPIIETANGFDVYIEKLNGSGRKQLKEAERKKKKLEDQEGPVSFTLFSKEKEILDLLVKWKSDQCLATGTVDYFSIDWCYNLISELHKIRDNDFGGMLSCLHVGNTLIAAHFCMYTEKVWHSWFPTYNHNFEIYSPGSILLYTMIKEAAEQKIRYIDLGKGVSLYKKRVMTDFISVAEGCVILPSFSNSVLQFFSNIESYAENTILKPVFSVPGRIIKKVERKNRYK